MHWEVDPLAKTFEKKVVLALIFTPSAIYPM